MSKELVVYFSVYGKAKSTAEEIARQIGADIVEIQPVVPYDNNQDYYDDLAAFAKKEHDEDRRPAIANQIDISSYDRIYIGYPMWWYTFPMIIYTFFDQYDFSGKTIIPFNTHYGSGDGGTYRTIQKLEPNAKVLQGLPINMMDSKQSVESAVHVWLQKVNQ